MVAYFTSRGALLGDGVSGHLVASAFGVFKRPMVVDAVAAGWARTDQAAILAARERGAVTSLRRMLGDDPDGLGWATEVLTRMAGAAPGEGRALFSGLLSLGDARTIRWARSGGPPTSCASTAATATSRRGSTPTSTPARSACSPTRGAASR